MRTKEQLRAELLAARRARSDADREQARAAVRAQVMKRARRARWSCVAAYEPLRTEPGSTELLIDLSTVCARVLVPVTLPDRDLDWVTWTAVGTSQPLGTEAIAQADAVLVPALAVGRDGTRLGRGGGSYDRALARVRPDTVVAALLFGDELLPEVPADPWDVPVRAVVRPHGWTDLGVEALD